MKTIVLCFFIVVLAFVVMLTSHKQQQHQCVEAASTSRFRYYRATRFSMAGYLSDDEPRDPKQLLSSLSKKELKRQRKKEMKKLQHLRQQQYNNNNNNNNKGGHESTQQVTATLKDRLCDWHPYYKKWQKC